MKLFLSLLLVFSASKQAIAADLICQNMKQEQILVERNNKSSLPYFVFRYSVGMSTFSTPADCQFDPGDFRIFYCTGFEPENSFRSFHLRKDWLDEKGQPQHKNSIQIEGTIKSGPFPGQSFSLEFNDDECKPAE